VGRWKQFPASIHENQRILELADDEMNGKAQVTPVSTPEELF
jgi:hypothetical protein